VIRKHLRLVNAWQRGRMPRQQANPPKLALPVPTTHEEVEVVIVPSCTDIKILEILAEAMVGVGIMPGDTCQVIFQKFGPIAILLADDIGVRIGNHLFIGSPEDFHNAKALYGIGLIL
jgi:hypothetical protein